MSIVEQQKLYEYLAHGDDKHKKWLKRAIENFFKGLPRPEVE